MKNLAENSSDNVPSDLLVLNEAQAARLLGISVPTLQRLRSSGKGPKFIRLSSRRIGYRRVTLDAWLAEREQAS